MNVNKVLFQYQVLNNILFKDGEKLLPDDLKVKIISCIIEFGKISDEFRRNVNEFISSLTSERFSELQNKSKEELTEEEQAELTKMANDNISKYDAYVSELLDNSVECEEFTITNDEFYEIVKVNAGNNVIINDQEVKSTEYLKLLYNLFVK